MKLLKKYLKDERIEHEEGGIRLTIRPLSTSQQAHLIDLAMRSGIEARTAQTHWCLANCVDKLSIDGKSYAPEELIEAVDLNDSGTMMTFAAIGKAVYAASLAQEDDVKK